MENVIAFNSELSGLYDSKPPISKAKMASITKAAMRAIKFYKHVVQSVEKFILKCKAEYKIPGLYVIDSIVRQSRHQFGPEKDVFAPRFARNLRDTFANLFRCPPEDKSRIIRVLNLWQKNSVFAPEVIQPIFDLADPSHPIYQLPPVGLASGSGIINEMASSTSNGITSATGVMDISMANTTIGSTVDDKMGALPDLSNNNLQQLLNDPNVIRQLQTLQNFQKFKQEDKQHKLNEMRMQEDAFEKHLQSVLKASNSSGQDMSDFNKEVEFVSEEQKIEVINLDGNSRSPTPDRDRYRRRRSRSRSRSRDRGGGRDRNRRRRRSVSRSRSRSPRSPSNRRRISRDRDRSNRDKEKEREHERERRKKGLPDLKKEHLSVCSTTLWVGHLSKLVYQEELSDTFGEYGDIVSIDQIVPRGCAFIVMNRRQDAYKAMQNLKNHKLQGRAITISWAAGKGVKSKEWKDYWDLELGVTYIPWGKLDGNTDFDSLEEGGMFDEDSMPSWMKDKINQIKGIKERTNEASIPTVGNMLFNIDTTQPPPGPPPPMMPMVPGQYPLAPPMGGPPRMLGPMSMQMSGIPMPPNLVPGMPPHAMMMATGIMPPTYPPMPTQVGGGPGVGGHMGLPPTTTQFPPPPNNPGSGQVMAPSGVVNISNDDQMDIEMEVEETGAPVIVATAPNSQMNFNQPPPMFTPGINAAAGNIEGIEMFTRDRNRNSIGPSRWGGRGGNDEAVDESARWRENGGVGGPANFNESLGGVRNGGSLNIPPLDLNNPPQRPDFMNDFDNRVGPRGGGPRGGNQNNGDFYVNMQNRFNQPTSLLQMRIPPPNAFNPRMGGPGAPMFMRGQGGMGNRQQGPGFFNARNAFDRDNSRGGGRGGAARSGNRGGRSSGPGGQGWSDEEDDGNSFKRRGTSGNRFRDRDVVDDRSNRERGGRRSGGDRSAPRDRHERELRDADRDRGGRHMSGNRRNSRDEQKFIAGPSNQAIPSNAADTEEDWDQELEEYETNKSKGGNVANLNQISTDNTASDVKFHESATQIAYERENRENTTEVVNDEAYIAMATADDKRKEIAIAQSTPLYDELPGSSTVTSTTSPKVASPRPLIETAFGVQVANDDLEKAVETTTSIDDEHRVVE